MAQSVWEKIGLMPQLQPEVFGPKYAMAGPLNNQNFHLPPTELERKDEVTPKTLQAMMGRAPASAPQTPIEAPASPTLSPLEEMIRERRGGIEGMQKQIGDIQANGGGLQNLNLSPFLAFGDQLGHTNYSQSYKAPVSDAEKIAKLKSAMAGEQGSVINELIQKQGLDDANKRSQMDQEYKDKMMGLEREKMDNAFKIAGIKASSKAEKKPDNNMNMAATYGHRMLDAENNVSQLLQEGANLTDFAAVASKANYLPNNVRDPKVRRLLQAQRNFINANLRKESGAAISPEEFTSANAQYFPQWGDDPETLKQKAFNRARAIEGMKVQAGDNLWGEYAKDPTKLVHAMQTAQGMAPQMKPQQASNTPAIGTVKGEYQFMGGDPADQNNWRQVR